MCRGAVTGCCVQPVTSQHVTLLLVAIYNFTIGNFSYAVQNRLDNCYGYKEERCSARLLSYPQDDDTNIETTGEGKGVKIPDKRNG